MGEAPPPGFYEDEGTGRERWWDGSGWTDHYRAPTDEPSNINIAGASPARIIVAGIGSILAVVSVFLPVAEATIKALAGEKLEVAENTLIQHPEGIAIIAVAVVGFLASFQPQAVWRALAALGGFALVGLAIYGGVEPPLDVTCSFLGEAERCPPVDVTPGPAVWTLGAGGLILAASALVGIGSAEQWKRWMTSVGIAALVAGVVGACGGDESRVGTREVNKAPASARSMRDQDTLERASARVLSECRESLTYETSDDLVAAANIVLRRPSAELPNGETPQTWASAFISDAKRSCGIDAEALELIFAGSSE